MIYPIFRRNIVYLLIFIIYQTFTYVYEINYSNPLPYLNFIIYFLIFILTKECLKKTKFNRTLTIIFFIFFGFLSIILSLSILSFQHEIYKYISYLYVEVFLRTLILIISIYLALYSFRIFQKSEKIKIFLAVFVSLFFILINHSNYVLNPLILGNNDAWLEWNLRNYITMVIVIFFLLIFWFQYFNKSVVLSEYLNSIVFLFTVSNLIEPLHYIALQWNIENWIRAQAFSLVLNVLMMFFWYARFVYLNSDIAAENERYLMNYQYLSGFVSKPRKSPLWMFTNKVASNSVFSILLGLGFLSLILFAIKKITLFLLLNTAFILTVVILALFFGIRSIKRDWQNQIGFFIKNKQEK